MPVRIIISLVAALLVASAIVPLHATSNYEYAKDEYGIVRAGVAPDRKMSLASHGDGELGDVDFHVWLMSEPEHRPIVALPDINSDAILDTAADAYHAFWSEDARHVALAFRRDRHEVELNLYSVESRHARRIGAPSLFKEVTSRDVAERDGRRQLVSSIQWRHGDHFLLKEYQTFVVPDAAILRLFGAYGRVKEKLDGGKLYIEFAAEAECVLERNHRYRVISLKPANPDQPPEW